MAENVETGQADCRKGEHPYIDTQQRDDHGDEDRLPQEVLDKEIEAINARRLRNGRSQYAPKSCQPTGVSLSGGGIRSASFCLGALQGLHANCEGGIDGVDYLSTVSGGGYVGCALTASMQNLNGQFPFTSADPQVYSDTPSVRHIRDYSNYLIPHGGWDVVTALVLIGRGLAANALIVLPVLLFCVWLTLCLHPDVASLSEPLGQRWLAADWPIPGVQSFWITSALAVGSGLLLAVWAVAKSVAASRFWQNHVAWAWSAGYSAELNGGLVTFAKFLFVVTMAALFIEAQPVILRLMAAADGAPRADGAALCSDWTVSSSCFGLRLRQWSSGVTLASLGAAVAILSKYLGDVIAFANSATGWRAQLKKFTAESSLWFAAIVIPLCLWLVYINITYKLLGSHRAYSVFILCLCASIVALFVNPNVTSLYRLYRDRLSKAFLFNPCTEASRDRYHDLPAYMPKLHELNTSLCPYPIINAALNIEGSRYANKRGREADFFIFTPEYTGSKATGYIGTRNLEDKEVALDLGTAMAISGAAISSNMGTETIKPLAFTLALLNVRLGYWLLNPKKVSLRERFGWIKDIRVLSLFREMFSQLNEYNHLIYLTDGGHIENLGAYSLLKRRCKLIVAIDAEADPKLGFGAFLRLERYARIDLGVTIDLPWRAIRDCGLATDTQFQNAASDGSSISCLAGPHCAAGAIHYGGKDVGILLYVKASMSGDESDYILDYKRRHKAFPHETTGDQFFGEEQLEAYRALGFHIMQGFMNGSAPFAVVTQSGETEDNARKRIRDAIGEMLLA